jgi:hypothetical protein
MNIAISDASRDQDEIATERDSRRYVLGQMIEEEEKRFEAKMLDHPEIASYVSLTRQMIAGLRHLDERGEPSLPSGPETRAKSWASLAAAAVALLALGAGLFFYFRESTNSHDLVAGSAARLGLIDSGTVMSYTLAHTRGRPDVPSIKVTNLAGPLEIRVLPDDPAPSGNYQVALRRQEGDRIVLIGAATKLAADANGLVPIFMNPAGLVAGEYTLALQGQATNEQRYRLRIER